MKRVMAVIFFLLFSQLHSSDFENKAAAAAAALASARAELASVRSQFEKESVKIKKLKGSTCFFAEKALKRRLSKANRTAYREKFLQAEVEKAINDLVTYSFILVDSYSGKIRQCLQDGCRDIDGLKTARARHLAVVLKYGSLETEENSDPAFFGMKEKEAVLDVRDELDKKIIRLEQRIFILEEELSLMTALNEKEKAAEIQALIKKMKTAMKELRADVLRLEI